MQTSSFPFTRDVVLVGGGHTHALVLRKWGMQPLPGARLTLINPGPTAPYSGMLPGFVAGHYTRGDLDIDLVKLARFAGARLILGAAVGMDPAARVVHVPGRPSVGFDFCSLDVGITSAMPDLEGFAAHAIPAKPLGPFAARWAEYLQGDGQAAVAVLGGGVAGAELAMAMAHALRERGRAAQVHLIDNASALAAVDARSRARVMTAMTALGVIVAEGVDVVAVAADHVRLGDGGEIASTFTTGAAGARAYDWLVQSGLDLIDGFVAVNDKLQSSDPAIFAVGDCAHFTPDPRPKAGVYAVRQAPVLHGNLVAALTGGRMRSYRPQKDYLKLISLGGQSALAQRGGQSLAGPLMWRWKDRIDRRFMDRFRDLPRMEPPALPPVRAQGMEVALGDRPLCGGCGSKVGRRPLRAALSGLGPSRRADVRPLPGDDAALLQMGGVRQVLSADHLRAFVEDPVLMTRIAAVHALGDVWAMGAEPQAVTVALILPQLSAELQVRTLAEIMETAATVIGDAGAEIVGGHTSVGAELTIGFSVTGLCNRDPLTLNGAQAGDALILTKPLGSGVLMAAEMAVQAAGEWIAAAWDAMQQGQGAASAILSPVAHAMTDVTGFGLAGHLQGMCEASAVGAVVDMASVPVMEGAVALAEQGVQSTIYAENRALVPGLGKGARADLLFDPQTSGGLLAAVPASAADGLVTELRAAGYPAARIGVVNGAAGQVTLA